MLRAYTVVHTRYRSHTHIHARRATCGWNRAAGSQHRYRARRTDHWRLAVSRWISLWQHQRIFFVCFVSIVWLRLRIYALHVDFGGYFSYAVKTVAAATDKWTTVNESAIKICFRRRFLYFVHSWLSSTFSLVISENCCCCGSPTQLYRYNCISLNRQISDLDCNRILWPHRRSSQKRFDQNRKFSRIIGYSLNGNNNCDCLVCFVCAVWVLIKWAYQQ